MGKKSLSSNGFWRVVGADEDETMYLSSNDMKYTMTISPYGIEIVEWNDPDDDKVLGAINIERPNDFFDGLAEALEEWRSAGRVATDD